MTRFPLAAVLVLVAVLFPFAASAQAKTHAVSLSWADPDPGVTFNVYRRVTAPPGTPDAPFIKVNAAPVTALSFVDTNVAAGTYTYYVTAVLASVESAKSNEATAIVPPAPVVPNAPSGLKIITITIS